MRFYPSGYTNIENIMKILRDYRTSSDLKNLKTTITLGTFDGVHIGHKRVLEEVKAESKRRGEQALVVTFDRHPLSVLKPGFSPRLLSTLDEKLISFEKIGIDITCVLSFSKHIAGLTAEEFIRDYLIGHFGLSTLIAGYDNSFGKKTENQEPLTELAQRLQFSLKVVAPEKKGGMIVKSSAVRALLTEGNVEAASGLLGRNYSLQGRVIQGNKLGKKLGIPTANIEPEHDEKILPASGVYAGWVEFEGDRRNAVINLGARPTFNIDNEAFETHLIGYDGDLYGRKVRTGFVRKLRDIVKFDTLHDLREQICSDIERAKDLINTQ